MKDINILVVFGGESQEHIVSCLSAEVIVKSLTRLGYQVYLLGISKEGLLFPVLSATKELDSSWEDKAILTLGDQQKSMHASLLANLDKEDGVSFGTYLASWYGLKSFDLVFPVLHGTNGEDGIFQSLLQILKWKYVGSEPLASQIGMNKILSKLVWQAENIPLLPYLKIRRDEFGEASRIEEFFAEIEKKLGLPAFSKPVAGGSSIGIAKIDDFLTFKKAMQEGFAAYDELIIEPYLDAVELEIGVLGNSKGEGLILSPIVEISKNENVSLYAYEDKYFGANCSQITIPARLSEAEKDLLYSYAKKAYKAIGGRHLSRVDFFMQKATRNIFINEINTLPGFTPESLYAKAFLAGGMELDTLVKKIVDLAL